VFPSPPPFRPTDEGAVSAVLDTSDIRTEKEKPTTMGTINVAASWFFSMGSAHNHVPFHQDEH